MPNRNTNPKEPQESSLDVDHFGRDFFQFSQDYRDNDNGPVGADDDYGIHTDQKVHPLNPGIKHSLTPDVPTAPKAFKPADDRLREAVLQALKDDEEVDPLDLEVDCEDGIVALTGTIKSSTMKHAAGNIAEALPGVQMVYNNLIITS